MEETVKWESDVQDTGVRTCVSSDRAVVSQEQDFHVGSCGRKACFCEVSQHMQKGWGGGCVLSACYQVSRGKTKGYIWGSLELVSYRNRYVGLRR